MATFLYLFRNDPSAQKTLSPEQMEQSLKKWMGWMESLQAKGHLKSRGERLAPTGKVVRGHSKTVMDGPFVEAKDTIGGLVLIEAQDLEQAVELSKGCPILEADGAVEVRPLLSM